MCFFEVNKLEKLGWSMSLWSIKAIINKTNRINTLQMMRSEMYLSKHIHMKKEYKGNISVPLKENKTKTVR